MISLTVEREEVWSRALSFYKKELADPDRLLKSLCVTFQDEPRLDAGAIKAEFFELVFGQIQSRLFEGDEYALVPVRESGKGLLFKLAGLAIAHSLLQSGPSFHALSPAVYYCLTSEDQDLIATHLEKRGIPRNAGKMYTCTLSYSLSRNLSNAQCNLNSFRKTNTDSSSCSILWNFHLFFKSFTKFCLFLFVCFVFAKFCEIYANSPKDNFLTRCR